jgi:hypothetical protein
MSIDLPTQHLHEPVVSCDTALSCLIRLDVCNGDDPEIEALRRRAVLDGNTLSASSLIELVGNFGVRAECTRLDWNGLTKSGLSYPILVFLKNTNAVAVTGTDSAAADAVSVWDPLHSDGEVLSVRREDFERAWSGAALLIGRSPSVEAEASPGSSEEQILDLPPEHGSEQAPMAEAQLLPGSAPATRLVKARRLTAIGLVAALGIGIPLWIYAVTDKFGPTEMPAKEGISAVPRSTLSTAKAAAHPMAPGAAASAETGPMPQAVPSAEMPAPPESPDGPAAAVAPANAAPAPEPAPDIARPAPAEPPTGPAFAAVPGGATPSVNIATASPSADPLAVEPRLSAAEIAALLTRGDVLFSAGDLAAARLFYERAADAGEAQAAVRLGEAFDPIFLDHAHLRGVRGNVETALSWYRRARDLGAAEAEILLNSLQAR